MLLHNITGDIDRIVNDMYKELRSAIPSLKRNVNIAIKSWEYTHREGRHTFFQVWTGTRHLRLNGDHTIPISEWNAFLDYQKSKIILFRRFN